MEDDFEEVVILFFFLFHFHFQVFKKEILV